MMYAMGNPNMYGHMAMPMMPIPDQGANFSSGEGQTQGNGDGAALQDLASQTPADVCTRVRPPRGPPSIAPKLDSGAL